MEGVGPLTALLVWGVVHAQEDTELRWQAAGQVDSAPFGVVDLGVRRGTWSAELLTDTLDLRWSPEGDKGRAWVALRGELGAAALMMGPWTSGAPAPEQGFGASYLGGEAGILGYGRHGLYAGLAGHARRVSFRELPVTEVALPAPSPWLLADVVAGLYRPQGHIWVRAGVQHDALGDSVQPHVHATATATPDFGERLGAVVELRAGTARGQSILTRTRVGGMNPYVVPIAGAGWGEWWAESYAIGRLGPRLTWDKGDHTVQHRLVVDGGLADDLTASAASDAALLWGVGSLNRWARQRWFGELDVGWGAGLSRGEGVLPVSVWFAVGRSWG